MSCACLMIRIESRKRRDNTVDSSNPIYNIWSGIRYRCGHHANYKQNHYYASRGILMSQDWADSFESFERDMGERPSPAHSVDRIDNARGYCAHNCRWATKQEQVLNRRNSIKNPNWPVGVYYHKDKNRYIYRRSVGGCEQHVGTYKTLDEALQVESLDWL